MDDKHIKTFNPIKPWNALKKEKRSKKAELLNGWRCRDTRKLVPDPPCSNRFRKKFVIKTKIISYLNHKKSIFSLHPLTAQTVDRQNLRVEGHGAVVWQQIPQAGGSNVMTPLHSDGIFWENVWSAAADVWDKTLLSCDDTPDPIGPSAEFWYKRIRTSQSSQQIKVYRTLSNCDITEVSAQLSSKAQGGGGA